MVVVPYYDDGQITVYCGDMRAIVPTLEPVDVIIADPPYGVTSLAWDQWVPGWLFETLPTKLQPSGSLWCFGSLRMFQDHASDFALWQLAQDLVWEKHNGSNFHADRFKRVHEQVAHYYPRWAKWGDVYKAPVTTPDATARTVRRKHLPPHMGRIGAGSYVSHDGGPRLMRSVLTVRSCHGYAEHPTQKPEGIILPLIEYSCPPGGVILDPFLGSGTTARVAKNTGRRCIGVEIDEAHCQRAVSRLAQGVLL